LRCSPTSTFQGQQNDTAQQQRTSRDQRQDRSAPSWENRGPAWEAWEGDTPPPIPEHLKSNDWIDQHYGAPQSDQKNSSSSLAAKSNTEAVVAANLEAGTSTETEDIASKQIPSENEASDRSDKLQRQMPQIVAGIPPKPAQHKSTQPTHVDKASSTGQSGQKQRDAAIKKMSYGDKLVNAAKMVPDLLKGDAKAAFKSLTTDPAFVAQLVGVSAVFAVLQATPAGPFIDAALIAVLGFSGGFSLTSYLLKAYSAKDETGLKESAYELKNLVEIVGLAALTGALRATSKVLGKMKGGATAEQASRKVLFDEMTKAGIKFTPENVIKIARAQDGRIIFLEAGNSKAGLKHIVEKHGAEFAQKGIAEAQIPDAVMTAVTKGKVVGYVGKNKTRPIYEVSWQGTQRKMAVTTGSNGFIVGAQIFR
jgi:hypothetical protein